MGERALDGQLDALEAMPENWNGYGEKRITAQAIGTCRRLHFSPVGSGGVQIELYQGPVTVEVCIDPDGSVIGVSWDCHKPEGTADSTQDPQP